MHAPIPGVTTNGYCAHCMSTQTMKICKDLSHECCLCGTQYPPKMRNWKEDGKDEAAYQTDWNHSE